MNRFCTLILCIALASCAGGVTDTAGDIYPDYRDVTVPANIAPLNFHYTSAHRVSTTFSAGGEKVTIRGRDVHWSLSKWKELAAKAAGGDILVSNSLGEQWTIHVSADLLDPYLTYRLIEPGYEVWHKVEIRERCIEDWDERAISDWQHTDNSCMNCHIHSHARGDLSIFYVRGPKGGAFLNREGTLSKLNLRDDKMISSTVYGELHPSGRYGVFSTNIIIPGFHTQQGKRLEVYDSASDLVICDFDRDTILHSPLVERADRLETFPCFSADGQWIYFCAADALDLPNDIESLKYSLCRIAFDSAKGEWGNRIETVWDASERGGSVCHPKCSPDGKWLMYTVADYGTFPLWHRECDLELMDLESGETLRLDAANSDRSDTYHSWSSTSRWFVFASKRGDGQYGKPYFCHIDESGTVSKPFVLPQKDSYHYDKTLKSYNIPDLGMSQVPFDAATIGNLL